MASQHITGKKNGKSQQSYSTMLGDNWWRTAIQCPKEFMDMEINRGDAASVAPSEPSMAEVSGTLPGASSGGRIAEVEEKV